MHRLNLRHFIASTSMAGAVLFLLVIPDFFQPYVTPRVLAFRVLSGLVFSLWLALATSDPRYREVLRWPGTVALLGLLGVTAAATAFGIDPGRSFWGDLERTGGWLTLAHLVAWWIATASCLRAQDWRRWLSIATLVAAAVTTFGIVNQWVQGTLLSQRLSTLSGNPTFLASYLLVCAPLAVVFATEGSRRVRTLFALAGLVMVAGVFLTFSRGALLALGCGVAVPGVWWISRQRARTVITTVGVAVVATAALGLAVAGVADGNNRGGFGRVFQMGMDSSSAQMRILGWKAAWEGFLERPRLGWGPENYYAVFNVHFDPLVHTLSAEESLLDRPHNQFLETLCTTGPLGLLAFVALLASTVVTLRRNTLPFAVRGTLLGCTVAYAVNLFFLFDTLLPTIVWLALLAYAHRLGHPFPDGPELRVPRSLIVAALVAWIFIGWQTGLRPAIAALDTARMVQSPSVFTSVEQLLRIESRNNWSLVSPAMMLSDRLRNQLMDGDGFSTDQAQAVDQLIGFFDREWTRRPLDVRVGLELMELGNLRYLMHANTKDLERAEANYHRLQSISATRGDVHLLAAQSSVGAGRYAQALERVERARRLNPHWPDPHWFAGVYSVEAGMDTTAAVLDMRRALALRYKVKPPDMIHVESLARKAATPELACEFWIEWTRLHPGDLAAWNRIVTLATQLDDEQLATRAQDHAKALQALVPTQR